MDYFRSISKGRFINDPGRPIEADAEDLVDPQLSVYGFSSCEELIHNAVALRIASPGDSEFIVILDREIEELAIPIAKTPGDTGIASVDDRHFELALPTVAIASLLALRVRARMTQRWRLKKAILKRCAASIHSTHGWPPAECWMIR